METFVEVVRRGMREGENEVAVTYTAPSRSDADAEGADEDGEDLPPLVPMRDGVQCPICLVDYPDWKVSHQNPKHCSEPVMPRAAFVNPIET